MKNRIFIFATYPAPYRLQLFEKIKEQFEIDVFFNTSCGDDRNKDWFVTGKFYTLDSKKGSKQYSEKIKQLKKYSLVCVYDYSSLKAINLIILCRVLNVPYVINCDGVMLDSKDKELKKYADSLASNYDAAGSASAAETAAKNYADGLLSWETYSAS